MDQSGPNGPNQIEWTKQTKLDQNLLKWTEWTKIDQS